MLSANDHLEVVADYLQQELSCGRMLGPIHSFQARSLPPSISTGLGLSLKDVTLRHITFPHGQSVNDGIDPSLCSLSYTMVDNIAAVIAQLGTGGLLAKVDIELAYQLIPVHQQDRPLQAVQ